LEAAKARADASGCRATTSQHRDDVWRALIAAGRGSPPAHRRGARRIATSSRTDVLRSRDRRVLVTGLRLARGARDEGGVEEPPQRELARGRGRARGDARGTNAEPAVTAGAYGLVARLAAHADGRDESAPPHTWPPEQFSRRRRRLRATDEASVRVLHLGVASADRRAGHFTATRSRSCARRHEAARSARRDVRGLRRGLTQAAARGARHAGSIPDPSAALARSRRAPRRTRAQRSGRLRGGLAVREVAALASRCAVESSRAREARRQGAASRGDLRASRAPCSRRRWSGVVACGAGEDRAAMRSSIVSARAGSSGSVRSGRRAIRRPANAPPSKLVDVRLACLRGVRDQTVAPALRAARRAEERARVDTIRRACCRTSPRATARRGRAAGSAAGINRAEARCSGVDGACDGRGHAANMHRTPRTARTRWSPEATRRELAAARADRAGHRGQHALRPRGLPRARAPVSQRRETRRHSLQRWRSSACSEAAVRSSSRSPATAAAGRSRASMHEELARLFTYARLGRCRGPGKRAELRRGGSVRCSNAEAKAISGCGVVSPAVQGRADADGRRHRQGVRESRRSAARRERPGPRMRAS